MALVAAARFALNGRAAPLHPRAVAAAALVGLAGLAEPVAPEPVAAPDKPSGLLLAALLTEVHRRTADLALALGRAELATSEAEEPALISWLTEGGAEVARRAPSAARHTFSVAVEAGASYAQLPPGALAVVMASFLADGETEPTELRAARAEEVGPIERAAFSGATAEGTPSAYAVTRGMSALGARVLLDYASEAGGTLGLVCALSTCVVPDEAAPYGVELAAGLYPTARAALMNYALARWLAAREPAQAALAEAAFERALALSAVDPARPAVGRRTYRAF